MVVYRDIFYCYSQNNPMAIQNFTHRYQKSYRAYQYKKLKTIKNMRWNSSAINYEIARSHAWFVVFFITCLTFLGWLAYKPIQEILNLGIVATLVLLLPFI